MAAAELTVDPRTGLRLAEIPKEYKKNFADLEGSIIHWFGEVQKVNRKFAAQPRVLIITDQCLYMCTKEGDITRCVQVKDIPEMIVDPELDTHVALVVKPVDEKGVPIPEYDMLFSVHSKVDYDDICSILDKVSVHQRGQPIPRRVLRGSKLSDPNVVNLQKPTNWRLLWVPVHSKSMLLEKGAGGGPGAADAARAGDGAQGVLPGGTFSFGDQAGYRTAGEEDWELVQQEFDRVKQSLKDDIVNFETEGYEHLARDVDMYTEMLDDREREIARLRQQLRTIHDDPDVWRQCPRCRERELGGGSSEADARSINALERKLEDYEHLIDHLQLSRANAQGARAQDDVAFSESTQMIRVRRELEEASAKVQELRRVIVESPASYPSAESRRDGIARSGMAPSRLTPQQAEARLRLRIEDLDRASAERDRELRQARELMREALRRQVEELERLRGEFQQYDKQIVRYLEDVFAGRTYPPGATGGQTPRELAQVTAAAARGSTEAPAVRHPLGQTALELDGAIPQQLPLRSAHREEQLYSSPPPLSTPAPPPRQLGAPAAAPAPPLFYQVQGGGYDRPPGSPPHRAFLGSHLGPVQDRRSLGSDHRSVGRYPAPSRSPPQSATTSERARLL
eukprot:TRINITY_DN55481_c0_g1_i1.p1 TRINITY_DN55481_c0_g1~~TRINITY_DN55481_c0_g1_i1.p1  ORF type:complete len:654 (+),score=201.08 TRINITY_DN55481_c0_g1_i1:85-1962(+)